MTTDQGTDGAPTWDAPAGASTPTANPGEARLRALRAQRAELKKAREALAEEADLAAQIEAEERAIRDETALAEAVEKFGAVGTHIAVVETALGMVIIRRASALKFRRFQDKGSFSTDDVGGLVRPCVVWPSAGELDTILDELPATLTRLASAVVTLAGQRTEEVAKK